MDDNTAHLVEQLKSNPAMLQRLMGSRDGQALLQMLTKSDRGAALQRAAQSAARGNPGEMIQMMRQVMSTAEGAALVERINQAMQK